ncbi:MAG: hypothetical protein RIC95_01670 [Vicingaceae bacterium]
MAIRLKYLLLIAALGALFLPLIQLLSPFSKVKDLDGDFDISNKPHFSKEAFKDGSYQDQLEAHLKDSIGFHNFFIRCNNQLKYSLFGEINSSGVVEGKDGMLIPKSYIESYLGQDFVGEDVLQNFSEKLKAVQDSLKAHQKQFVVLLVPGKASIYPEKIPDEFLTNRNEKTNYDVFIKLLKEKQINHLNLRNFLEEKKGKLESQLFANKSVHWSGNTVSVVADTMVNYLRDKFNYEMPYIVREAGEYTVENYRYTDYDIAASMNLLFHIAEDTLYYPNLKFYRSSKVSKPTLLGCGDSFFQSFKGFYPILDSSFSQASRLYYYNRFVDWPHRFYDMELFNNMLDIKLELERSDLIVVEMTDENIKKLGYGFIDDILAHYNHSNTYDWSRINQLKADPKNQAKASRFHQLAGYSYDQMLTAIAKGKLDKNILPPSEFEKQVQQKMQEIRNTPEWLDKVKKQAIEKNIPLEQNIRENAEWIINNS